ncbi:hypothetical protein [Paraburkholderia phenazinium]|uniref:hypothetical protein n=1 Tax=Paraburkholderia phenazinium TaxID=60549 RepID=UPI00158D03E0|nr:hypothetical protein [Paraburkholderia phenazinium]
MTIHPQATVAGEILRQAFEQICQDYPLAAPVDVDAFVKSAFHRANYGNGPLNVRTIVSEYRCTRQGA